MANPSTNTKRLTTLILWAIAWAALFLRNEQSNEFAMQPVNLGYQSNVPNTRMSERGRILSYAGSFLLTCRLTEIS